RGLLERRLCLNRCDDCGYWHHRPKPRCPRCLSARISATEVGGTGTIYLLTFLHQGPAADGVSYSPPHPVVTVDLDEQVGLRFTTTVIDASAAAVVIGARVRLDWIQRDGRPFPVWRLDVTDAAPRP